MARITDKQRSKWETAARERMADIRALEDEFIAGKISAGEFRARGRQLNIGEEGMDTFIRNYDD